MHVIYLKTLFLFLMGGFLYENGFTYFDTAAPYLRTSYTITDKLSPFMIQNAEEMEGFFESQLERLGVEYIDVRVILGTS